MYIHYVMINKVKMNIDLIVWDKVADAFQNYNFKSMAELNDVYQWQYRCQYAGYNDMPIDTHNLFKYLGMEAK